MPAVLKMLEIDGSAPGIVGPAHSIQPSKEQIQTAVALSGGKDVDIEPKKPVYESDNHLTDLKSFAESMSAATERCLKTRKTFNKVAAVVSYWEKPKDLPHMKQNAQKLVDLFRDQYEFDVMDYEIPRKTKDRHFVFNISPHLETVSDDPNSLFIFYYGGHASVPNGTLAEKRLWMPENRIGQHDPKIEWSSVSRTLFNGVQCQVLFILDCCHAGAMVDEKIDWTACEMLAACPPEHKASATQISSFTMALYKELKDQLYDVIELHSVLCSTQKREEHSLKSDPWYRHFTTKPRYTPSAMIRRSELPSIQEINGSQEAYNGSEKLLARLKRTSNAKVLIAVTFKGTASGIIDMLSGDEMRKEFESWFRHTPIHVLDLVFTAVQQVVLESLFESNSCITTWSIPIWLWDCLAYNPRYRYLGVIRSSNFATGNSQRLQLQGPNRVGHIIDSSQVLEGGWTLVRALPNKKPVQPDDSSSTSSINASRYIIPRSSQWSTLKPARGKSSGGLFSSFLRGKQDINVPSPSQPKQNQPASLSPPAMSQTPTTTPLMIPQSFQFIPSGGRYQLKVEDVVRNPSDKKYARRIDETRSSRGWRNTPLASLDRPQPSRPIDPTKSLEPSVHVVRYLT